ncbi:MAG: transcriptional regulator NrdR [Succinivibrionaceae bacterium]
MNCPFCNAENTKVVDTRILASGTQVRRRRECLVCHERFTTFEQAEFVMPTIIKSDGIRQPFNEAKIRAGMYRALEKRSVGTEDVENAINRIKSKLRTLREREVKTSFIGKLVMDELEKLDPVAYIRFASVYLSFKSLQDFSKEIAKLEKQL